MLNDIYNRRILELAADIPRLGRLEAPHGTARAYAKLCGSSVVVDLMVKDSVVVDFAHEVKACALGQAASSVMARLIVGSTSQELRETRMAMLLMLKDNGKPPGEKWAELAVFEPVRSFKERHASTLLTFDAVVAALDQIEGMSTASDL